MGGARGDVVRCAVAAVDFADLHFSAWCWSDKKIGVDCAGVRWMTVVGDGILRRKCGSLLWHRDICS